MRKPYMENALRHGDRRNHYKEQIYSITYKIVRPYLNNYKFNIDTTLVVS